MACDGTTNAWTSIVPLQQQGTPRNNSGAFSQDIAECKVSILTAFPMGIFLMAVSYSCSITAIYLQTPLMGLCPHVALLCIGILGLFFHTAEQRGRRRSNPRPWGEYLHKQHLETEMRCFGWCLCCPVHIIHCAGLATTEWSQAEISCSECQQSAFGRTFEFSSTVIQVSGHVMDFLAVEVDWVCEDVSAEVAKSLLLMSVSGKSAQHQL